MSEQYTQDHLVAVLDEEDSFNGVPIYCEKKQSGWVAVAYVPVDYDDRDEREANAERLVACWNACEGIDTADMKAGSVSVIQKLHGEAAKLVLAQRDELLAALKVFQDQCEMMESANWRKWEELASPEEFERWVKSRATHMALQARSAIAKVEGGA